MIEPDETAISDLLQPEFPWPKPGDVAFTIAARDGAQIDQYGHSRLVLMMTGYKEAADHLVNKSIETGYQRDVLVYPIVFNYRQFIELNLKFLISAYGPSEGIEANWKSHDINFLWTTFQKIQDAYGIVEDDDKANPVVQSIIAEFSRLDPQSFSFRYPVDREGNLVKLGINDLDLVRLKEVMESVDAFFKGCDGYLDHLSGCIP